MGNLLFGTIMKQLTKREAVLQIGCGTGYFAKLMLYSSYNYVRGVDISEKVIRIAQHSMATRHRSKFILGYFDEKHTYDIEYDTVICTEVFEYADCDIAVLESIKEGAKVIFTVPGFLNKAFTRWFLNEEVIKLRYKDLVDIKDIKTVVFNDDYCKTYVINCIKK